MPRFVPFAGLRYDTARVNLDMVIAPPYDVVDVTRRGALAGRHSANAIRVEMPEADYKAGLDPYQHAAEQLEAWQEKGTLIRDATPTFTIYRMTTPEGAVTNGVIGALGIEEESAAEILPHEETLPKPASDRLDLLRATRANLSPIWGLSLSAGLTELFAPAQMAPPDVATVDDDGVLHEAWVVDDATLLASITASVASSPLVVADGHHRLQTALAYRAELIGEGGAPPSGESVDPGSDEIMALVVELSDQQLHVGPIHRLLAGLPEGFDVPGSLEPVFDRTRVGEADERSASALAHAGALGLLTREGTWLLTPKDTTDALEDHELDSALVRTALATLPDHDVRFTGSWHEAYEAVQHGTVDAAVLLRAVTVEQITAWAEARRRMPPKSTYFAPKPRTGIVYRTLDDPEL